MRRIAANAVMIAVLSAGWAGPATGQSTGSGTYQPVKVCTLVAAAEVKKLAPWPAAYDAQVAEKPIARGSSCDYPTAYVQVTQFQQIIFDGVGKDAGVERIAGVGDASLIRNSESFADLLVKVGPHLVSVQMNFGAGKTFANSKNAMIEIGKAFAARLR